MTNLYRVLFFLASVASPALGQQVLGPWDDATTAPRGVLRAGIGVYFGHWNERFARITGRREALGTDLSRDVLGPAILPGMGTLAQELGSIVGAPGLLSLGTLTTRLEVTEATTPITLEYGLTGRVSLRALIPYVKNHVSVTVNPNAGTNAATLGLNPAFLVGAGARSRNDLVIAALDGAATTLGGELTRCLGNTDPTCAAINANRDGATALVASAQTTAAAIASVFGTTSVTGSAWAPLAGSELLAAVNARLTELSDQFASFLGAAQGGAWVSARPVPAGLMAAADLDALITKPEFGIVGRAPSDYEHSHLGDVEIGAKVSLYDTFGPPATTPLAPRPGSLRLALGGVYRLGTGQLDLPDDFTDVGTGDRQVDLEVSGYLDAALSRRLWTSLVVRRGLQRPDRLVQRIPDHVGDPFPEVARRQMVSRDLGDYTELELAPRYVPSDALALSAVYRYRTKGEDRYQGNFQVLGADGSQLDLDASVLGTGSSSTEQVLGFAITFSTVRGYALRESRWPLEVSLMHTQVLSGRGGIAARSATGLSIRIYRSIGRRNPLRRN